MATATQSLAVFLRFVSRFPPESLVADTLAVLGNVRLYTSAALKEGPTTHRLVTSEAGKHVKERRSSAPEAADVPVKNARRVVHVPNQGRGRRAAGSQSKATANLRNIKATKPWGRTEERTAPRGSGSHFPSFHIISCFYYFHARCFIKDRNQKSLISWLKCFGLCQTFIVNGEPRCSGQDQNFCIINLQVNLLDAASADPSPDAMDGGIWGRFQGILFRFP